MILVGITSGLASQMNQYAFLRLMKHRYPHAEVKMAMGCDWLRYMERNGYELDHVFGIERDVADWMTVRRLANFYPGHGLKAKIMNGCFQLRDCIIGPKPTQISLPDMKNPNWSALDIDPDRDVLFWGNYAMGFFDEIREELLRTFTFKPTLDSKSKALMSKILGKESVAIHVRRGDYFKYGYKVLGLDYYRDAVRRVSGRIENPCYFVFSDEPDWVAEHFDFLPNMELVRGNDGLKSYVDLQLMSACKHCICANSGFSAFAAWLNTNTNKIVIDPP